MSKGRILEVVARFPPYRSGTGNVAMQNALQLVKRGYDVTVASLDHGGQAFLPEVALERFRIGNAGVLGGLSSVGEFDLMHLHLPFILGGRQAARLAKKRRVPLLITYNQDLEATGARGLLFRFYNQQSSSKILDQADAIIVPTMDYARHSVVARHLVGPRLVEIPNGVDTHRFQPGPDRSGILPDWPQDLPRVLFVGGLDRAHAMKGLPVLLEAFATLSKSMGLIVVGSGDLQGKYERQASALGIRSRVHFAGSVSEADLPDYYRSSAFTILPSTTRGEIFGLVLVEAMACGRPVIASDLPGVRAVVAHGETGLLVPPGDAAALGAAIMQLISSPSREQWGKNGRDRVVRHYDWDAIGSQLEDTVNQLLTRARANHVANHVKAKN